MANDIIFKTNIKKGAAGAKGDAGVNYEVPTNGIIYFDGDTVPEGYEQTTTPTGMAVLVEKSITANGVYNASSDSADGYSKVTVNVQQQTDFIVDDEVILPIFPSGGTSNTYNFDTPLEDGYYFLSFIVDPTNISPVVQDYNITFIGNSMSFTLQYASDQYSVSLTRSSLTARCTRGSQRVIKLKMSKIKLNSDAKY